MSSAPVSTPQAVTLAQSEFQGLAAVARDFITPSAGIYARLWGSAKHDQAEGIHKPLLASCLYLRDAAGGEALILLALDLSWWRSTQDELEIRSAILEHTGLPAERVILHVSHTHAAPSTSMELADRPGGHLIAPYRERIKQVCKMLFDQTSSNAVAATLSWSRGACRLAFNREMISPHDGRIVIGLNPEKSADDTLWVGRLADSTGRIMATLVNYACHPTSVGGANRLISPDYVGAMRETMEAATDGAPCLFLHGASGDLTPRRSFEASITAADQNGLEIGHAALAALAAMSPPGTALRYAGLEESGTQLALWRESAEPPAKGLRARRATVPLEFLDMPETAALQRALESTTEEFMRERLRRKIGLRAFIDDAGSREFPFLVWQVGAAFIVAVPAEAHSVFQMGLRDRFPGHAVIVLNIANGYRSYLPPAESYELNTYQAQVAIYKAGAAEKLLQAAVCTIEGLLNKS